MMKIVCSPGLVQQGTRISVGMPHRHFIASGDALAERLSHLRFIESQLGRHSVNADLQRDIFAKAKDVFEPFGKTVEFAIIFRGNKVMTIHDNSMRVSNHPPAEYPEEEIVLRALREKAIIHKTEDADEHLAFPLLRGDETAGMILLLNQFPKNKFTRFTMDDYKAAREFALIASEALTGLSRRSSLC